MRSWGELSAKILMKTADNAPHETIVADNPPHGNMVTYTDALPGFTREGIGRTNTQKTRIGIEAGALR